MAGSPTFYSQGKPSFKEGVAGQKMVFTARFSFETGEQGAIKIRCPMACKVIHLRGQVVKAIGATDNGTITAASSGGAMTGGVLTFVALDALGVEKTATPTTNTTIAKDTDITLTPAKTTAGGKVHVTVQIETTL